MTRFTRLLALLLALVLAAPYLGAAEPLALTQTIVLKGKGGNLDHLAVDSQGGRVFVANKPNNTLDIVDLKTGKLIMQIADQGKVSGVDYAPDLDIIYVGNGAGQVNAFSGKDYKQVFSTPVAKADNVHYHPATKMVYAAHGSTFSALDAKTGEIKSKVTMPGDGHGFEIDKKAGRAFVSLTKPNQVGVVDLGKNEVAEKFALTMAEGNSPLVYDNASARVYVGCRKQPMVVVFDAKTGKEVSSVAIPGDIDDLLFDPARNRLYAICGEGSIAVIEKTSDDKYKVIGKVDTAKKARTGTLSTSGDRLYLGVPKQDGSEAAEVRVYTVAPSEKK
jgi:DNA-binding beta-propeller fold protein YncE